VFELIAEDIEFGSNPRLVFSISVKTGVASTNKTELAVEINENEGIIISSFLPKPYANKAACNEEVPEFNVTQ